MKTRLLKWVFMGASVMVLGGILSSAQSVKQYAFGCPAGSANYRMTPTDRPIGCGVLPSWAGGYGVYSNCLARVRSEGL